MRVRTVSGPAVEPVSYADVKAHLRLDDDAERPWIVNQIAAARIYAERLMQRSLVNRVLELSFDEGDTAGTGVVLPRGPVVAVTSITDKNGATVAAASYELRYRADVVHVHFKTSPQWPVVITYTAGYGPAGTDVPADIRLAMLLHVAHAFRHREATSDRPQHHVAHGLDAVYSGYRIGSDVW